MKFELDPTTNAACLEISDAEVEATRQIEPGVMADYDAQGHIVGIEILSISKCALPAPLPKAA